MDPVSFALILQFGIAAVKAGGEVLEYWHQLHAIVTSTGRLTPEQDKQLDDAIEGTSTDPNWKQDDPAQ